MIKNFESADSACVGLINECITQGASTSPRGKGTIEMTSQAFIIHDPRKRVVKARELRMGYPAAKLAWDLGARRDVATLQHWNPRAMLFADDGVTVQGEDYGARWNGALGKALKLLQHDRATRRAWVPILRAEDLLTAESTSNTPCAIGFGLRIISGRLVMQVVMRSNSLWGVFPYDVFLFTVLQELIAFDLGIELGWYEHFMLSAHVYDYELREIKSKLEDYKPSREQMAPIARRLAEATTNWTSLLDQLSWKQDSVVDSRDLDPIEALMIANRPEGSRV